MYKFEFGRQYSNSYGTCNGYDSNKLDQPQFKAAVLKTSPCVVGIVSLGFPPEMPVFSARCKEEIVFIGSGTIIECNQNAGDDGKFSATILTTASLFYRTNSLQPSDIEVDIYLPNRKICKGKVSACDFHYNLAIVNVQLDAAVQPPKLTRDLDDIMSIQPTTNHSHSDDFELYRHSTSFKIYPGDYVAALMRCCTFDFCLGTSDFGVGLCRISVTDPIGGYNELYSFSTEDPRIQNNCGGPIINCHGEVIGILALQKTFIPINLVSRWWNSYKNCKAFSRPWLGLVVANLQSADFNFLERILQTFPTLSSGIIVKEVVNKSPAHRSGLLTEDVIVECNGAAVGSPLDFFDKIWGRVGESVELGILRGAGPVVNVKVTVREPKPNMFYSWAKPRKDRRPVLDSEMSKVPGSESSAPEKKKKKNSRLTRPSNSRSRLIGKRHGSGRPAKRAKALADSISGSRESRRIVSRWFNLKIFWVLKLFLIRLGITARFKYSCLNYGDVCMKYV